MPYAHAQTICSLQCTYITIVLAANQYAALPRKFFLEGDGALCNEGADLLNFPELINCIPVYSQGYTLSVLQSKASFCFPSCTAAIYLKLSISQPKTENKLPEQYFKEIFIENLS